MCNKISITNTLFQSFSFLNKLPSDQTTTLQSRVNASFALPETSTMNDGLIKFNVDISSLEYPEQFYITFTAAYVINWDEKITFTEAKNVLENHAIFTAYQDLSDRLKNITNNLGLPYIELSSEYINELWKKNT